MATRGRAALTTEEAREVCDLYRWGMEVWMILAFYDISKKTLKLYLRRAGVPARANGRPKSSQQRTRVASVAPADPFEDAYRSVRGHALDLLGTHTEPHQPDESMSSCLEEAS